MGQHSSLIVLTNKFESLSVILPVIDETVSLLKTVEILLRDAEADICEIIIVVCGKTVPAAMSNIEKLRSEHPQLISVLHQTLPFVGGAYQEAFDLAKGSHTLLMASDLETDPNEVAEMIRQSKLHPDAIIATSRWIRKGSFHGYNKVKLVANWLFQRIFSALYSTNLSDMTFGFRLFPTKVIQSVKWEEFRHPFFFETIIKPLRLGVPVVEIPTGWVPRIEGESHNSFFRNFEYFRPGLRVRFTKASDMLRESSRTTSGDARQES